jgi:alpha-glucosidase
LDKGKVHVSGYLPSGVWYNWYNHELLTSHGMWINVAAKLTHIPIFVRGGFIIPTQKPALTLKEQSKNDYELLVALDENGMASGDLYVDDGISLDVGSNFTLVHFKVEKGIFYASGYFGYKKTPILGRIRIIGVSKCPQDLTFSENVEWECSANSLEIRGQIKLEKAFTVIY